MESQIAFYPEHLDKIRTQAETVYPEECCGLLLGRISNDRKTVVEVVPTRNSWGEEATPALDALDPAQKAKSKRNRFTIAPTDMLQGQKYARDRHLTIVGIYHSHPDAAAVPSQFDLAIAWEQYSYLIVSVHQGHAAEVLSWTLNQSRQVYSEEILTIDAKDSKI